MIIFYVFIFIKDKKIFFNSKILSIILISGFLVICTKNINRIITRLDQNYYNAPWPSMYSLNDNENKVKKFTKIFNKNNDFLYYYSNGVECMYTKSPCSNFLYKNLKKGKIYGYKIYYSKKY